MSKNKYIKRTKLSNYKIKQIIRHFVVDLTAIQTSKLLDINRNSVNRIFNLIRDKIYEDLMVVDQNIQFSGEIELDESYFGARRVRGKRGRRASGKTKVFGILKRQGKVYVKIVENCSRKELLPIIKERYLVGKLMSI